MTNRVWAKSLLATVGTAALLGGCGFQSAATGDTRNEAVSLDLDDVKSARVGIRMGGGKLRVSSGTAKLMEGKFTYNVPEWKPVVDYKAGSGDDSIICPKNRCAKPADPLCSMSFGVSHPSLHVPKGD